VAQQKNFTRCFVLVSRPLQFIKVENFPRVVKGSTDFNLSCIMRDTEIGNYVAQKAGNTGDDLTMADQARRCTK
jgi:hypothetical protein